LASCLTLAGVAFSIKSNAKQQAKQLAHDAREKDKDRTNTMRRDVYLKAAEEISRVGNYFGKIPLLDPAKVNVGDGLVDFLAVSSKLQLVANSVTSGLAGELTTTFGEILIDLLVKAKPIHEANTLIRISNDFYDVHQLELNRILTDMRHLNEAGNQDPQRFAALQHSFDVTERLSKAMIEQRETAFKQQLEGLRNYNLALMESLRSVGPLQIQVSAAIRGELGLETDIAAYEARLQANWKRMEAAMRRGEQGLELTDGKQ